MIWKRKIANLVGIALAFFLGVFLDRCFKDFPYLQLDPKVGVLDIANLLVTIAIAFMIPFFITRLIEDKKSIKSLFIDEVKELIAIIAEIKKIITEAHALGEFKATDRDKINYVFHNAEVKINSIVEQMEVGFKKDSEKTKQTLIDLLFAYKDYLTDGELMLSTFVKVDDRFYKENNAKYSKIETGLKTLIQEIYKF